MEHSTEIIPYLCLGDAGFVREARSFSLIVNCCPEIDISYPESSNVLYLRFHDDPRDNNKFLSQLETHNVLAKIHEHVTSCKPVIVHCAMGIQRSASVVACYLLKYGITNGVQNTLDFIRSKRVVAFYKGTRRIQPQSGLRRMIPCSHRVSLTECNFLRAIKEFEK
jgi:rhodanese-related sulfurtransferase